MLRMLRSKGEKEKEKGLVLCNEKNLTNTRSPSRE